MNDNIHHFGIVEIFYRFVHFKEFLFENPSMSVELSRLFLLMQRKRNSNRVAF